ncbi:hypothetical protein D018_0330B, partial [Vibrio parahaemolyticus VP2007-007]
QRAWTVSAQIKYEEDNAKNNPKRQWV